MPKENAKWEEAFGDAAVWAEVFRESEESLRGKKRGDAAVLKELLDQLWGRFVTADEEETARAKELIMWYATKKREEFEREGGEWGQFMKTRPEVIAGLRTYFSETVDEIQKSGKESGKLREFVGQIKLKSEAMRLTLHIGGLFIDGEFSTDADGRIIFSKCRLTWQDKGDLGNQSTQLSGYIEPIQDGAFVFAEQVLKAMGYTPGEFDIKIHWELTPEEIRAILPESEKKLKRKMKISPPPKEESGIRRCGVPCKDFHRYGLCGRLVRADYQICYQHA